MLVSKAPEIIGNLLGFQITNTILTSVIISIIFIIFVVFVSGNIDLIPSKIQSLIEIIYDFLKNLISEQTDGDHQRILMFFPWVGAFFLFIAVSNLLELIPGAGIISIEILEHGKYIPLFRTPNSDLNSTVALTFISVIITQYFAFKLMGWKAHLKRYFNFRHPLDIFAGLFEFISEFTKVISLSFRLFGNIYAGDVIILLFTKLGGEFLLPLPFLAFEILVDIIQAGIFAMLTLSFMAILTDKNPVL